MLILAGITIQLVLSDGGIFSRAEQAKERHEQAKAREALELVLIEAQMQKYEGGLTDEQLDNKIGNIQGELLPKEKPENPNLQNVIVDGYIFEIDRSVPKIVDYIGKADGIIITAVITQNGNWQNSVATLSGTIKTYSGGTITNSTAAVVTGNANITGFPIAGGNYTIGNITEDTDIKITVTDSTGKTAEKTINVRLIRDTTPPVLSNVIAKADNELKIKISVNAVDNESGLKELRYSVSPTTVTPQSDTITSGQEIELTTTAEGKYTITFTATDNAGNTSTAAVEATTTDGGVLKHIKTPEGLKEVNTKNIYGAKVLGYDCQRTGVEWQVFYIDEEDDHRVYLISKEYMAPPTTGTELPKSSFSSAYPKAYRFDSILNKYEGTIPNTDFTRKFLGEYVGISIERENLQATNYMLDQTVWSEYINSTKADYAFGGPTIPLFQVSYNDVCKTSAKLERRNSEYGYDLKIGTGIFGQNQSGLLVDNAQVGLYFNSTGAESIWMASPAGGAAHYVWTNHSPNGLGQAGTNHNICGFRPVVSLKSNVIFTDNGDGTYTIN